MNEKLVWYASYGSNLSKERFMRYICGGIVPGSEVVEIGCRDKTPPRDDATITIPYPFYFAESSAKWQDGGVAFIGLEGDRRKLTYGRMYLITEEQFLDVVHQENGYADLTIDLDEVKKLGSKVFRKSWYGNIVYLGECRSYPIYTFTAYWPLQGKACNTPSEAYLKTITKGLKESYSLSDEQIADYLLAAPGIKGVVKRERLIQVMSRW